MADVNPDNVRALLEAATPGEWQPSRYNYPESVDYGKVYAIRPSGTPFSVGRTNHHFYNPADQHLFAASKRIAAAYLAVSEERDEARRELARIYVLSGADPDGNSAEDDGYHHLWRSARAEIAQTLEDHKRAVEGFEAALADLREQLRMESANVESLATLNASLEATINALVSERDAARAEAAAALKDAGIGGTYYKKWRAAENKAADYKAALEEILKKAQRGLSDV